MCVYVLMWPLENSLGEIAVYLKDIDEMEEGWIRLKTKLLLNPVSVNLGMCSFRLG